MLHIPVLSSSIFSIWNRNCSNPLKMVPVSYKKLIKEYLLSDTSHSSAKPKEEEKLIIFLIYTHLNHTKHIVRYHSNVTMYVPTIQQRSIKIILKKQKHDLQSMFQTKITSKQGHGHQTGYEPVDPKQNYKHARFERNCF